MATLVILSEKNINDSYTQFLLVELVYEEMTSTVAYKLRDSHCLRMNVYLDN
jgi:hypothetical protein